jgi:hypothetical protein
MSKKRKGKYTLSEALDLLEATYSRGYPDNGTGVAGDDDRPPGNIIYGEKYKKTPYFNKLTDFQDSWEVDLSDWKWDEFEHTTGMEDIRNYSNTIMGLKDLLPKETWDHVMKRFKYVSKADATKGFIDALQPWRKGGEDQTGDDDELHMDIDAHKKGAKFKDAVVSKKKLAEKIDMLIV